jgi:type IV pilus assembly protein PilP
MKIIRGSIAVTFVLLATGGAAQEKMSQAAQKAAEVPQKEPTPATPPVVEESKKSAGDVGSMAPANLETPEPKVAADGAPRSVAAIRRDPFRPFTLNLRATVRRRDNLSPLERYELGHLKLVGIVWNTKNPTALVEDASGLGYTVRVGTPIGANEGRVVKITPNTVAVEEEYIDLYGAKKKREVSMRLAAEKSE